MDNFFSIAIPCYGYNGNGGNLLDFNLSKINNQTFKDFEIIICDHSIDDTIEKVVKKWFNVLNIKYYKNDRGRGIISPNLNECLKKCKGKWIKILFQDDFFFNEYSLEITYNFIITKDINNWIISKFCHSEDGMSFYREFNPHYNDLIWNGNNTIGCPTVLTIKNDKIELFNEELHWLMDVEYYKRMYDIYGYPSIINQITVVNRVKNDGVSSIITEELKIKEENLLREIYG